MSYADITRRHNVLSYQGIRSSLGRERIPFLTEAATGNSPESFATRIQAAYRRLTTRSQWSSSSVMIADLVTESGLSLAKVQAHIRAHPAATLDEGDWSCATPRERAAAMMLRGRPRVYVRFN